jgi:GPI mannosyltransferase 3
MTEGLPLLLTTYLPFSVVTVSHFLCYVVLPECRITLFRYHTNALCTLSATIALTVGAFSLISHKEVRFIYPLLPVLHVLATDAVVRFYTKHTFSRRFTWNLIPILNLMIAIYVSRWHQSGVIDVMGYIRNQHEVQLATNSSAITTVGFLMPCHSTPWRSHLIYPGIKAWALTCEPPIDIPVAYRSQYLDEADRFYMNPSAYMTQHLVEPDSKDAVGFHRVWPEYLVFFEQMESFLRGQIPEKGYKECWRGFNSHWHDDSRRKGDVVVWCRGA